MTMPTGISFEAGRVRVAFSEFDLAEYERFLKCKQLPESEVIYDEERHAYTVTAPARFASILGIEPPERTGARRPLGEHLFDYQRFIVETALKAKRYAVWADTGLGKTAMFLEGSRQIAARTDGRVLILSPLQIIAQTIEEAEKFYGQDLAIERIGSRDELAEWCRGTTPAIGVCNYEKMIDGVLPDMNRLAGLVLDESSLLRSGGGVIKWNLIKSGRGIEYKLSCTATPAPNDTMEYASQASFLEKLRTEADILWTYFTRDKRGEWRVKPHAQDAFYRFMASWSIYLRDPAHYGWTDILSTLPPPRIQEYRLEPTAEQLRHAQALFVRTGAGLFGSERMGVKQRSKLSQIAKGFEYRGPAGDRRIERVDSLKPGFVAALVRREVLAGRQVLVWTVFDEESAIIADLLRDAPFTVGTLHGSDAQEDRQPIIDSFRRGGLQVLISKPQLLAHGMNFQFCRAMVFSGFDDSFERMYQAIRRAYRYGQTEEVQVHVPYIPELEGLVFENIKAKQERFDRETAIQEENYRKVILAAAA